MGFRLILTGLVFFCNPFINLVDILPDFIGCIFIAVGLRQLADLDDGFATARRLALWMIPVSILKLALALYFNGGKTDALLPATFLFGVVEIILTVFFSVSLYGAIENTTNLFGGDRHLKKINTASLLTTLFLVARSVLAFLPETLSLEKVDEFAAFNNPKLQFLSEAKPFVVLFCIAAGAVLGIYCLAVNASFFGGLARDEAYCGNFAAHYRERITNNPKLRLHRAFRSFYLLMAVGAALTVDVVVDTINFTPDLFAYAVMLAAVIHLGDKAFSRRTGLLFLPLAAVSLANSVVSAIYDSGVSYVMEYESYFVHRNMQVESGSAIFISLLLSAAEGALFVLYVYFIAGNAAKRYSAVTDDEPTAAPAVIFAGTAALLSLFSAVAPLVKARLRTVYINDTLTHKSLYLAVERWEIAQGICNLLLYIVIVLFARYFLKQRERANIEI